MSSVHLVEYLPSSLGGNLVAVVFAATPSTVHLATSHIPPLQHPSGTDGTTTTTTTEETRCSNNTTENRREGHHRHVDPTSSSKNASSSSSSSSPSPAETGVCSSSAFGSVAESFDTLTCSPFLSGGGVVDMRAPQQPFSEDCAPSICSLWKTDGPRGRRCCCLVTLSANFDIHVMTCSLDGMNVLVVYKHALSQMSRWLGERSEATPPAFFSESSDNNSKKTATSAAGRSSGGGGGASSSAVTPRASSSSPSGGAGAAASSSSPFSPATGPGGNFDDDDFGDGMDSGVAGGSVIDLAQQTMPRPCMSWFSPLTGSLFFVPSVPKSGHCPEQRIFWFPYACIRRPVNDLKMRKLPSSFDCPVLHFSVSEDTETSGGNELVRFSVVCAVSARHTLRFWCVPNVDVSTFETKATIELPDVVVLGDVSLTTLLSSQHYQLSVPSVINQQGRLFPPPASSISPSSSAEDRQQQRLTSQSISPAAYMHTVCNSHRSRAVSIDQTKKCLSVAFSVSNSAHPDVFLSSLAYTIGPLSFMRIKSSPRGAAITRQLTAAAFADAANNPEDPQVLAWGAAVLPLQFAGVGLCVCTDSIVHIIDVFPHAGTTHLSIQQQQHLQSMTAALAANLFRYSISGLPMPHFLGVPFALPDWANQRLVSERASDISRGFCGALLTSSSSSSCSSSASAPPARRLTFVVARATEQTRSPSDSAAATWRFLPLCADNELHEALGVLKPFVGFPALSVVPPPSSFASPMQRIVFPPMESLNCHEQQVSFLHAFDPFSASYHFSNRTRQTQMQQNRQIASSSSSSCNNHRTLPSNCRIEACPASESHPRLDKASGNAERPVHATYLFLGKDVMMRPGEGAATRCVLFVGISAVKVPVPSKNNNQQQQQQQQFTPCTNSLCVFARQMNEVDPSVLQLQQQHAMMQKARAAGGFASSSSRAETALDSTFPVNSDFYGKVERAVVDVLTWDTIPFFQYEEAAGDVTLIAVDVVDPLINLGGQGGINQQQQQSGNNPLQQQFGGQQQGGRRQSSSMFSSASGDFGAVGSGSASSFLPPPPPPRTVFYFVRYVVTEEGDDGSSELGRECCLMLVCSVVTSVEPLVAPDGDGGHTQHNTGLHHKTKAPPKSTTLELRDGSKVHFTSPEFSVISEPNMNRSSGAFGQQDEDDDANTNNGQENENDEANDDGDDAQSFPPFRITFSLKLRRVISLRDVNVTITDHVASFRQSAHRKQSTTTTTTSSSSASNNPSNSSAGTAAPPPNPIPTQEQQKLQEEQRRVAAAAAASTTSENKDDNKNTMSLFDQLFAPPPPPPPPQEEQPQQQQQTTTSSSSQQQQYQPFSLGAPWKVLDLRAFDASFVLPHIDVDEYGRMMIQQNSNSNNKRSSNSHDDADHDDDVCQIPLSRLYASPWQDRLETSLMRGLSAACAVSRVYKNKSSSSSFSSSRASPSSNSSLTCLLPNYYNTDEAQQQNNKALIHHHDHHKQVGAMMYFHQLYCYTARSPNIISSIPGTLALAWSATAKCLMPLLVIHQRDTGLCSCFPFLLRRNVSSSSASASASSSSTTTTRVGFIRSPGEDDNDRILRQAQAEKARSSKTFSTPHDSADVSLCSPTVFSSPQHQLNKSIAGTTLLTDAVIVPMCFGERSFAAIVAARNEISCIAFWGFSDITDPSLQYSQTYTPSTAAQAFVSQHVRDTFAKHGSGSGNNDNIYELAKLGDLRGETQTLWTLQTNGGGRSGGDVMQLSAGQSDNNQQLTTTASSSQSSGGAGGPPVLFVVALMCSGVVKCISLTSGIVLWELGTGASLPMIVRAESAAAMNGAQVCTLPDVLDFCGLSDAPSKSHWVLARIGTLFPSLNWRPEPTCSMLFAWLGWISWLATAFSTRRRRALLKDPREVGFNYGSANVAVEGGDNGTGSTTPPPPASSEAAAGGDGNYLEDMFAAPRHPAIQATFESPFGPPSHNNNGHVDTTPTHNSNSNSSGTPGQDAASQQQQQQRQAQQQEDDEDAKKPKLFTCDNTDADGLKFTSQVFLKGLVSTLRVAGEVANVSRAVLNQCRSNENNNSNASSFSTLTTGSVKQTQFVVIPTAVAAILASMNMPLTAVTLAELNFPSQLFSPTMFSSSNQSLSTGSKMALASAAKYNKTTKKDSSKAAYDDVFAATGTGKQLRDLLSSAPCLSLDTLHGHIFSLVTIVFWLGKNNREEESIVLMMHVLKILNAIFMENLSQQQQDQRNSNSSSPPPTAPPKTKPKLVINEALSLLFLLSVPASIATSQNIWNASNFWQDTELVKKFRESGAASDPQAARRMFHSAMSCNGVSHLWNVLLDPEYAVKKKSDDDADDSARMMSSVIPLSGLSPSASSSPAAAAASSMSPLTDATQQRLFIRFKDHVRKAFGEVAAGVIDATAADVRAKENETELAASAKSSSSSSAASSSLHEIVFCGKGFTAIENLDSRLVGEAMGLDKKYADAYELAQKRQEELRKEQEKEEATAAAGGGGGGVVSQEQAHAVYQSTMGGGGDDGGEEGRTITVGTNRIEIQLIESPTTKTEAPSAASAAAAAAVDEGSTSESGGQQKEHEGEGTDAATTEQQQQQEQGHSQQVPREQEEEEEEGPPSIKPASHEAMFGPANPPLEQQRPSTTTTVTEDDGTQTSPSLLPGGGGAATAATGTSVSAADASTTTNNSKTLVDVDVDRELLDEDLQKRVRRERLEKDMLEDQPDELIPISSVIIKAAEQHLLSGNVSKVLQASSKLTNCPDMLQASQLWQLVLVARVFTVSHFIEIAGGGGATPSAQLLLSQVNRVRATDVVRVACCLNNSSLSSAVLYYLCEKLFPLVIETQCGTAAQQLMAMLRLTMDNEIERGKMSAEEVMQRRVKLDQEVALIDGLSGGKFEEKLSAALEGKLVVCIDTLKIVEASMASKCFKCLSLFERKCICQ